MSSYDYSYKIKKLDKHNFVTKKKLFLCEKSSPCRSPEYKELVYVSCTDRGAAIQGLLEIIHCEKEQDVAGEEGEAYGGETALFWEKYPCWLLEHWHWNEVKKLTWTVRED